VEFCGLTGFNMPADPHFEFLKVQIFNSHWFTSPFLHYPNFVTIIAFFDYFNVAAAAAIIIFKNSKF